MKKLMSPLVVSFFTGASLLVASSYAFAAPMSEIEWSPVTLAVADGITNVTAGGMILLGLYVATTMVKQVINMFRGK